MNLRPIFFFSFWLSPIFFLFSCLSADEKPLPEADDTLGLIFYSERSGNGDLFYFDLEEGTTHRITKQDSIEYNPSWIPQLGLLYYLRQENGLSIMESLNPKTGEIKRLGINPGFEERPDWTSDGSKTVFNTKTGDSTAIVIGDPLAKAQRIILQDTFLNKQARWSPDETQIAFTSNRAGGQDLFIYDLETDSILNVTASTEWEGHPEWTPNGKSLIAYRYANRNADIYQFDIPKRGVENDSLIRTDRRIIETPSNELIAKASPKGNWIAFGGVADKNWEVFITQSDAEHAIRITDHPGFDGDAIWVLNFPIEAIKKASQN